MTDLDEALRLARKYAANPEWSLDCTTLARALLTLDAECERSRPVCEAAAAWLPADEKCDAWAELDRLRSVVETFLAHDGAGHD